MTPKFIFQYIGRARPEISAVVLISQGESRDSFVIAHGQEAYDRLLFEDYGWTPKHRTDSARAQALNCIRCGAERHHWGTAA